MFGHLYICRNLSEWKIKLVFIVFNKKFSNKSKEQTKSKVPSQHFPIILGLILNMVVKSMWKNKLSSQIYMIFYKFMFVL